MKPCFFKGAPNRRWRKNQAMLLKMILSGLPEDYFMKKQVPGLYRTLRAACYPRQLRFEILWRALADSMRERHRKLSLQITRTP